MKCSITLLLALTACTPAARQVAGYGLTFGGAAASCSGDLLESVGTKPSVGDWLVAAGCALERFGGSFLESTADPMAEAVEDLRETTDAYAREPSPENEAALAGAIQECQRLESER